MSTLDVTCIDVVIEQRRILNKISFSFKEPEFIGLLGPNGAGKSTLLKATSGLINTTSGSITIDGKAVGEYDRHELARKIAYLAQDEKVHWPLDVETVVSLGRIPHKRSFGNDNDKDRWAIAHAMERTDIVHMSRRNVLTLSGGERARVLLARALAVEADILFVDEPLSALDPLHSLNILELLRQEVARGTTVIAVLHDITSASRFCDRILLLNQGEVLTDGPPEEVLRSQNIDKSYGVTAYYGRHQNKDFVLPWLPGKAAPIYGENHG